MKAVLRRGPTLPELAILRRLLHECFAMTSTALKQIVEKTDDTPARKLSQPERSNRLERQQARLTGVRIQGVYEPSDRLIDRLVQMYEDNRLPSWSTVVAPSSSSQRTASSRPTSPRTSSCGKGQEIEGRTCCGLPQTHLDAPMSQELLRLRRRYGPSKCGHGPACSAHGGYVGWLK